MFRRTACAAEGYVVMPASYAGAEVVVINDTGQTIQVYGNGTDTIDGTAGATGVSLATHEMAILVCLTAGTWHSVAAARL